VLVKPCPLNRTVRVEWETDAANDYFDRTDSPGELLMDPGELCEHKRLWNGEFTARFRPPSGVQVGDRVTIALTVTDFEREKYRDTPKGPFTSRFELAVETEDNSPPNSSGKPSPKAPNPNGKAKAPRLDLPTITEVHRDEWKPDYTEHTALRIRHGETDDNYVFVVNMDNTFLLTEMKRSAATDNPWWRSGSSTVWPSARWECSRSSGSTQRSWSRRIRRRVLTMVRTLAKTLTRLAASPTAWRASSCPLSARSTKVPASRRSSPGS